MNGIVYLDAVVESGAKQRHSHKVSTTFMQGTYKPKYLRKKRYVWITGVLFRVGAGNCIDQHGV
jgi:hypothetical protein